MLQSSFVCLIVITLSLLGGASSNFDTTANNYGGVRCQKCVIHKSLDNDVIFIRDEMTHTETQRCVEYNCEPSEDWCLVTYYRNYADGESAQGKFEYHECGNKQQRDADVRCQKLLQEDDENRIKNCKTKRSGTTVSVYTATLSVVVALLTFIAW